MEQTSSGTSRSVKNNNSKTQVTFRPSTTPKQVNVLKVDRDVSLSVFRGTNKVFLTDLTGVKSLLSAPPPPHNQTYMSRRRCLEENTSRQSNLCLHRYITLLVSLSVLFVVPPTTMETMLYLITVHFNGLPRLLDRR